MTNTITTIATVVFILLLNVSGNSQQSNNHLAKSKTENEMNIQSFTTTILVEQSPV